MSDDLPFAVEQNLPEGYRVMNWTTGFGRQIGPLYQREIIRADGAPGYERAFRVMEYHTNGLGIAHGGMLMSFADMALGHAVSFERHVYWVTVRLALDFLSGARLGEWIEGAGELLSEQGRVLHRARARLVRRARNPCRLWRVQSDRGARSADPPGAASGGSALSLR
jgi:Uncharacterized protein, possibly involved in aromatic compounds catabolism